MGSRMRFGEPPLTVTAVERALVILNAFTPHRGELGLSELARVVGLSKATTYRIASTLEQFHYLSRDPQTSRYRLGLRAVVLGTIASGNLGFGDQILPYMHDLERVSGCTVNLAVLENGEVVYIKRVRSKEPLQIDIPVGGRAPAHATALGKILLAYLPEAEVDRLIASRGLVALTKRSVTDPTVLKRQLRTFRELGYVMEKGEFAEGVHCVSAPIFDHRGRAIASMAIAGQSYRLPDEKLIQLKDQLIATVSKISTALGYRPDGLPLLDEDRAGLSVPSSVSIES